LWFSGAGIFSFQLLVASYYPVKQLKNFRSGDRCNDSSGMMTMIVGFLSGEKIEPVASYVSGGNAT
jgi:cytochrome c553